MQPKQKPACDKLKSQVYVDQKNVFLMCPPKGSRVIKSDIEDKFVVAGFLFMVADPNRGDKFTGASIKVRVRSRGSSETTDFLFKDLGKADPGDRILDEREMVVNGSDAVVVRLETGNTRTLTKLIELWVPKNDKLYMVTGISGKIVQGSPEESAWRAFEEAIEDSVLSFTVG